MTRTGRTSKGRTAGRLGVTKLRIMPLFRNENRQYSQSSEAQEPPFWQPQTRFVIDITAAEHIDRVNADDGVAICIEDSAASGVKASIEGSKNESICLWRTQSQTGFFSRPTFAADFVTIRFVDRGSFLRYDNSNRQVSAVHRQALFTPFVDTRRERVSPGFAGIAATLPRGVVIGACQSISGNEITEIPDFLPAVDVENVAMLTLQQTLRRVDKQLSAGLGCNDFISPLLQELLVYQFVSAWPSCNIKYQANSEDASMCHASIAIDFIEANLSNKIRVSDIALAANISVRSLQNAFKKRFGYGPIQYLISRRLDKVHDHLKCPSNMAIDQAARAWGFTHMSDFSRRYFKRYGYLPSKTPEAIS